MQYLPKSNHIIKLVLSMKQTPEHEMEMETGVQNSTTGGKNRG
jgi:hypothetical protein